MTIEFKHCAAYQAIQRFYGTRRAKRSGVLLMDHIDQGLRVLMEIGATNAAMRAYCLHPLFQADQELLNDGLIYATGAGAADTYAVMLAMEYRQWANAWLSDKVTRLLLARSDGSTIATDHLDIEGLPSPGPMPEVRAMLIADKVQNYKDFRAYHYDRHERARELNVYFLHWLKALDITTTGYKRLCKVIDKEKA